MQGPLPVPMPATAAFWEGTAQSQLLIQRCLPCDKSYFYPRPFCPRCGSDDVEWQPASGRATLTSYVINFRPLPPFDPAVPIIVALVELEEGPRMVSYIVGLKPDPALIEIGMRLRVEFEPRDSFNLPVFRKEGAV